MAFKEAFIAELKHEGASTKKILERVPVESLSWKPHEKSMTLERLATHVADIPHWVSDIIHIDNFDFVTHYPKRDIVTTQQQLLDLFQHRYDKALADLQLLNDETLNAKWTVGRGGQVFYELPKKVAIRSWAFNHLYHHRGQLSVYLRLLNIAVPGMYGPSADESM